MSGRPLLPSFLLVLALLIVAQGCGGKSKLPSCPGEEAGTLAGGDLPEPPPHAVSDPTADGALHGRPARREGSSEGPSKMILLLDFSGSMYGGYGRPQVPGCSRCAAGLVDGRPSRSAQPYYVATPEFQEFLARWLDAATPAVGDLGLEILLFNGRVFRLGESGVEPFAPATELRFAQRISQASPEEIASWLQQIPGNPYEVDPQAPNTTDSRAGLEAALAAVSDDEAILWLISDNIVDTEGGAGADPEARLTTEFYRALDADPRVQMISAYPIFRADGCSWMCSTSLFAYGMYVSPFERPSSDEFHRLGGTTGGGPTADGLLWSTALQKLAAEYSGEAAKVGRGDLAGVPVRLKPIDTETLTIAFGRPALRCARAEFGQDLRCRARIEVQNSLRHQTVESARLSLSNEILLPRKERGSGRLSWASAACAGKAQTLDWHVQDVQGGGRGSGEQPIEIGPLAPLQKTTVEVNFTLPPVQVDTRRSTLLDVAFTNQIVLDGLVQAEIRDFRTSLAIHSNSFARVYGSAQLPAIFRKREVGSAGTTYRIQAVLDNDGQTLALLVLLGGGSIAALVALVAMRFQRKQFTVFIDGVETARLSLPRWSRREVEIGGSVRASIHRGWGADYKIVPKRGVRLRRDGPAWILRIGDDIGQEHRLEIRRGWSSARRKTQFESRMDNW
ncbi:MAG TPA: hypothetical protein VE078_06475 [Thermoanaerobaculia bacterium]|nr:hypothetical protein [Thermoanaerobaculia bacterium]